MGWMDALPEDSDLRKNESLTQIPDVATLAKSYVDAQSHIGNSLRIPSEDAGAEDVKIFNDKVMAKTNMMMKPDLENADQMKQVFEMLGRPSDTKGYELEADNGLLELFHAQGLNKAQAKNMVQHFTDQANKGNQDTEAKQKEGMKALSEEWGFAFDQRFATAVSTLKKTGAPEALVSAAEEGKVNADTIQWAYQMAQALGSENPMFTDDGKGAPNGQITPSEAKSKVHEIMNNREHAYWDRGNPNHKQAILDMVELNRAIGR